MSWFFAKEERENNSHEFVDKYGYCGYKLFVPFNVIKVYSLRNSFNDYNSWKKHYINSHSIIHYFFAIFVYELYSLENQDNLSIDESLINKIEKKYLLMKED